MKAQQESDVVDAQPSATITYPEGLAKYLNISAWSVRQMRARGDCPRLYSITSRVLCTTEADVREWLMSREVATNYKMREPTAGSGRAAHDIARGLMSIRGGKSSD